MQKVLTYRDGGSNFYLFFEVLYHQLITAMAYDQ